MRQSRNEDGGTDPCEGLPCWRDVRSGEMVVIQATLGSRALSTSSTAHLKYNFKRSAIDTVQWAGHEEVALIK